MFAVLRYVLEVFTYGIHAASVQVYCLMQGVPGLDTNCRTLDGSLPEELTTTKALRQVVQGSRSRLPPHGRSVALNLLTRPAKALRQMVQGSRSPLPPHGRSVTLTLLTRPAKALRQMVQGSRSPLPPHGRSVTLTLLTRSAKALRQMVQGSRSPPPAPRQVSGP